MLSLLSGEILRLCLACSTKLTTACKPRCFCSWGPPPRVSACWSPRSSHRASGSPTPGESKKEEKTFRKFAASGAMQLSIFPASRFSADGKTLPSYLPFPDHGLPFLHASSPNSPSCGFILSFPVSLIYKILPYKLCNRPLEFTKNKNKKLNS